MRLKRFLLRYYPPGIAFEYMRRKGLKTKLLDLLDFTSSTDTTLLAREIAEKEPLITERVFSQLVESLNRLQARLISDGNVQQYSKFKTLRAHLLPLTNVTFDKQGKKCITGSYDRTCKLWDVNTGSEIHSYAGHTNVVYALAFNNPFCDKILTGSFDKTARLWSTVNGECYQTFWGHTAEVVSVKFSPRSDLVATASMDSTARLFSIVTGQETSVLQGHTAEVIALQFNNDGNQIITGSFDHTVGIWDTRTAKLPVTKKVRIAPCDIRREAAASTRRYFLREASLDTLKKKQLTILVFDAAFMKLRRRIGILTGHQEEISNCLYNFSCSLVASGSMDATAKAWDPRTLSCIATFSGHTDEVLDIAFDLRGRRLATGSSDCSAQVWDVHTSFSALATMEGHLGEVSKLCFSPSGMQLLTASSDNTARLWDSETGNCAQILKGHKDDVFSCAFNYRGDTIITASKDNTCRIWR